MAESVANHMKTLFEITPERAAAALKRLGFIRPEDRARQERATRPPLAYVETPENVKQARAEALYRALARAAAACGGHYDR